MIENNKPDEGYATEEQLQSACTMWFHNTFPSERKMLFHVDNNSWNKIIGARKKALGVCAGVSDLILIIRKEVVFIEMKLPRGSHSEEQEDFHNKVSDRGHMYVTIRRLQDFKIFIVTQLNKQDGKSLGSSKRG